MEQLRDDTATCTSRLWVQFSTFEGDRSGEELTELMLDRARAGVDVRFLVDHYSDAIANDILPTKLSRRAELKAERSRTEQLRQRLRAGGVQVRRTAPLGPLWQHLLHRDHKKMVVVDDRAVFVGGVNISDHNFGWHDFMVRITSPLVDDLANDFATTWTGRSGVPRPPAPDAPDFVLTQAPGRETIMREAVAMVERARDFVILESPSLLDAELERALADAARRGVTVDVIVPARHNRAAFRIWSANTLLRLARAGVVVHRYLRTDGMTHAKALVADDWATFGSFNFFGLESLCQKELNVFTSDPCFVRELRAFLERDLRDCRLDTSDRRHTAGDRGYGLVMRIVRWRVAALLKNPEWVEVYA